MEYDFQEGGFQLTKVFECSVLGTSTSYQAYTATAGAKNKYPTPTPTDSALNCCPQSHKVTEVNLH